MPSDDLGLLYIATDYHDALPMRIREYLNHRGITDSVIDLHLLGWNGDRITIPIFKREGGIAFFKLAKDPKDRGPGPKMLTPAGQTPELYGWERIRVKPCEIVICEGEFDRLVLERHGFGTVTSTGGAGVFRSEWADVIQEIPEVYLCFDHDEAGRNGALRIARMIPHAKIVELPEDVGEGGDVTDFFVRLSRSREDFRRLLQAAHPAAPPSKPASPNLPRTRSTKSPSAEVARIKERIPIETFIERYLALQRSGKSFKGLCPFHEDHVPSLVVYPLTRSFHCFGCNADGDVITFVMMVEHLTFPEAVQFLQRLAH